MHVVNLRRADAEAALQDTAITRCAHVLEVAPIVEDAVAQVRRQECAKFVLGHVVDCQKTSSRVASIIPKHGRSTGEEFNVVARREILMREKMPSAIRRRVGRRMRRMCTGGMTVGRRCIGRDEEVEKIFVALAPAGYGAAIG